jgi:hypothetical protein
MSELDPRDIMLADVSVKPGVILEVVHEVMAFAEVSVEIWVDKRLYRGRVMCRVPLRLAYDRAQDETQ